MQVPINLTEAFKSEFEAEIAQFCVEKQWLTSVDEIGSKRFLTRSIVPHIEKLSELFNRLDDSKTAEESRVGLQEYWKQSSNPKNLRLAYFLYFMPSNLYRVATIFVELARLGFKWPFAEDSFKVLELGAGPASGACGWITALNYADCGFPKKGYIALIDQDKAVLENGREWLSHYARFRLGEDAMIETRTFHRTLSAKEPLLPRSAPSFQVILSSYFLNEFEEPASVLAKNLFQLWENHLQPEGLVVLCEPALKVQSRRLLEVRKELIKIFEKRDDFQILTPCLGSQSCGALAKPEDWCHEIVSWWRPPYFRTIDALAKLDRKTLPYSYLVVTRSRKPIQEILPGISKAKMLHRLVSPSHKEGRDLEFFMCGQDGKRRARYRPSEAEMESIDRGSILMDADFTGDVNATRISKISNTI